MCRLSLIVTAVTLLLAGSASAAHRAGFWGGRYCLQGQDWGYPGLCQFSTYQSCQATASGTLSARGASKPGSLRLQSFWRDDH